MTENPQKLLPRTCELIREGIERKLHMGVQLYVSQNGQPIANFAMGYNRPDEPLTPDVLSLWLSSGKPVTAIAVMQLVEAEKLTLDARVASFLPEFAANGKEEIRIRDLLTHTAGLRPVVSGWPHASWEEIITKICNESLRRNWNAEQNGAYDPGLSWFILGEILSRIDGRPIDQIVRQQVLEPLRMLDCWLAIPPNLYTPYGERIGVTYALKDGELTPTPGHQPDVCTRPAPGGSMRGPISQLGLLYEMLLRDGIASTSERILSEKSVQQMTCRQRIGRFDLTFQHEIDFGLGFIINSNHYGAETVPYGFGRHASAETFGHGGAQSSIGFADPQHQLVVAAVANGCPGEELHNTRFRELNSAIYEDLGLAQTGTNP